MNPLKVNNYIEARDIPDAWFQAVNMVQDVGHKYVVQQGSYVGQTRMEFSWITIYIKFPYAEPWDQMLPDIPQHLGIPNPVASGYLGDYVPYLMSPHKQLWESYTYGQRMTSSRVPHAILQGWAMDKENYFEDLTFAKWIKEMHLNQIHRFIELLKETPNTNQAILQVGQPTDCLLKDPPCLRQIDMKVMDGELIFYPYFRSWDLWGGFPANLGGIAILQKYMADEIGIKNGPIIASSKGLHLYGYVEELAKLRCMR